MANKLWTREELILAIKLYCEIPFGKMHRGNQDIVNLAKLIKRTPSAVAYKLVNFASFDPSLKNRGIKGLGNTSRLDKEIWNEFYSNWEEIAYVSANLFSKLKKEPLEKTHNIDEHTLPKEGKEREQFVRTRVNQSFFRKTILASYDFTCCITGLKCPDLLIAGHIIPWAEDQANRMNPRNGLCINALHDRAFEHGLITITSEFRIKVSKNLKKKADSNIENYFLKYENREIILPTRFLPDKQFLEQHYAKHSNQY
ncbi:MAG: HNH endonuclease [Bacteroidales bacterium]|nr:HNH endonuclease [Bacteroidales bacterium]MCF8351503.1 HNH endonuclease [Bacteroidales bacterium]MCF8377735.1 HNH endonuclease [Bacteroidales bacterium]MCF8402079.1 HNH endonuclease [Bacteroidales bacterium]